VNYQPPQDVNPDPGGAPEHNNNTYSGPNMDIDVYQGTIQHKILSDNVTDVDIFDRKFSMSAFNTFQMPLSTIDPGTSITIIMYHETSLKTITWPDNFKFLGGESELSTEGSTLPLQVINGDGIDDIQAIDILHAFYDGQTWWCSITKGYV
jgi:hypothetical protein